MGFVLGCKKPVDIWLRKASRSIAFALLAMSVFLSFIDPARNAYADTTFVDSFDVSNEDGNPQGLAFNSDGTKMFVTGNTGDDVNEYSCSTGFDVSTCSFTVKADNPFDVSNEDATPQGLAFNSDGTKMFVTGDTNNKIFEYDLTTAFDVSTAGFSGNSFDVSGEDTIPKDVAFSSDGTKMFVVGDSGDDVNEYTLSTGFDLSSTVSFVDSFSVASEADEPSGVAFSSDGTMMFVTDIDPGIVNQYSLSTGFDVSTAAFVDSFSVNAQEVVPQDLSFSSDGLKMFVVGSNGDNVYEYTLDAAFDLFASVVWDDPDNGDRTLSDGDTLTITFNQATDRPGGTEVQNKSRVDSMIDFENSLGENYTGQWISITEFQITIVDATGATATVGDDTSRQTESFLIFGLVPENDGGTAFVNPGGVTTNSTDFIFVGDTINDNVQIFHPNGTYSGVNFDTTGGTAFDNTQAIATNSTDFIFVAEAAGGSEGVQIFDPDGTTTGVNLDTTGGTPFSNPVGVATNSTDFIFVADLDNDNVQIFDPDGAYSGVNLDTTDGTAFDIPQGIATNSTDFIFVADAGASPNVQIFHPNGTTTGVNLDTNGGTAFDTPVGVATNSTDFIFVSDQGANNVQIFNPDGTFAGTQPTTGGTAFSTLKFLAVDSDDRLIVSDSGTDKVQVFGPASIQDDTEANLVFTNTIATIGNLGLATQLTGVAADDPDNGDKVLSTGDTLTFSFDFPTNATAGGSMTLAEINANFTFGGGAKTIGTAASGVWDTTQQLTVTIESNDGDIKIGDAAAPSTDIADSTGEALISGSTTISGDFGVLVTSGGGGGVGDRTPPSFTTGFSEGEPILHINDDSFTATSLGGGSAIVAEQGESVSFEVVLFDNGGPGNIEHVDLFLNKHEDRILNFLTETYITYDNGKTSIHDPDGIIESAQITKSESGNKAVFLFDVVFAAEIKESDILIQAWDLRRNVVYLHVKDIVQIIPSEPGQADTPDAPETVPEHPTQQVRDTDAKADLTIRQWAGYDIQSATDEQLLETVVGEGIAGENAVSIPTWIKDDVAEWYVSGDITYEEFETVVKYMYDALT